MLVPILSELRLSLQQYIPQPAATVTRWLPPAAISMNPAPFLVHERALSVSAR
jgi:hypothetical protein